jgi:hypothetical protein
MVYRGTIKGGGVVLPVDVTLPEGTEVLVALPDHRAESVVGSVIRETSADFGRPAGMLPTDRLPDLAANPARGDDHLPRQQAPPEEPPSYPVADFLSPSVYAWDEDVYAAEEAVRAYLSDSHADH